MSRRSHLVVATVTAVGLLALHLDFWRAPRVRIYFGWIPEELAWRLGWMLLAFLWLVYATGRVWRREEE